MARSGDVNAKTAAAIALLDAKDAPKAGAQTWGSAKTGKGTVIAFAVLSAKQPIAHAVVVKTALSIAEEAGYTDLAVLISSIGDAESRKRFTRELGNFFRKNADALDPEMKHLATKDPDAAYRALLKNDDPLLAKAPRSIDYLSEGSRKTMLSALSLFESVGIPYVMQPRLSGEPNVHAEVLFAIEGTDKSGERVRVATGGRFDEHLKRERGKGESAIGISIEVPQRVDCEAADEAPACFVVHVGDAAKLKSFSVLEALWRAHIAVGQALMAESLRDQMLAGKDARTRYVAIIGQREALDGTVIVRSTTTQMQTVLPLDKLGGYVSRGHRG
jgi:histidyl-tRNA synthetase